MDDKCASCSCEIKIKRVANQLFIQADDDNIRRAIWDLLHGVFTDDKFSDEEFDRRKKLYSNKGLANFDCMIAFEDQKPFSVTGEVECLLPRANDKPKESEDSEDELEFNNNVFNKSALEFSMIEMLNANLAEWSCRQQKRPLVFIDPEVIPVPIIWDIQIWSNSNSPVIIIVKSFD